MADPSVDSIVHPLRATVASIDAIKPCSARALTLEPFLSLRVTAAVNGFTRTRASVSRWNHRQSRRRPGSPTGKGLGREFDLRHLTFVLARRLVPLAARPPIPPTQPELTAAMSASIRASAAIGIVTLLVSAALRVLGILLDAPALAWLALAVALVGIAILVARLVRRRREARGHGP